MKQEDIVAVATASGTGGIAVIRVSGSSPLAYAEKTFRPSGKVAVKNFEPYRMYPGEFDAGGFKDFGLCVYFRAPRSFTGEDVVEFHLHGGAGIANGAVRRLTELGCRPAGRGEFTKRAFLNGKLSLSSAEGLIAMINGESESEIRAGYSLYIERLKEKIDNIRNALKAVLADFGAHLDYPDEVEEDGVRGRALAAISAAEREISALLASYFTGRKLAGGVKVGIVGRPNTGKSSLLNALLSYEKAIVSAAAGTTRDVVEGTLIVGGVKFELKDTAGIRAAEDEAESMGVERSRRVAEEADVLLVVLDGSEQTRAEDEEILALTAGKNRIIVSNKSDKGGAYGRADIVLSAKTGENIDKLKEMLFNSTVGKGVDPNGEFLSERRHYDALSRALAFLGNARAEHLPLEMAFSETEAAWRALGEITGETASEEIVEEIFSKFCVGK